MNKDALVEKVAAKVGLSKKQTEDVLDQSLELITQTLKEGGKVSLTGFGTFQVTHRAARKGVNPQKPSEKIDIPAVNVPKFKAGKTLKDAVK